MLRFKTEISMLLAAIVLFTFSTVCYSYVTGDLTMAALSSFPYRHLAMPFISLGSVLMGVATVSYTKRSRNCP
jgi:hypothetical protein